MRNLLLVIIGLAIGIAASAQMHITGIVVDDKGQPLSGALVSITDTAQSTTTDLDGSFNIELQEPVKQIHINYLGYKKKSVNINVDSSKFMQDIGTIKLRKSYNDGFGSKNNYFFVSAQCAIPNLIGFKPAFGGMVGWSSKRVGAYAKVLISQSVSKYMLHEGDALYLSDKGIASYNSATVGAVVRLFKPLYLFAGAGATWSQRAVESALSDRYYAIEGGSYTKVGIDLGLMLRFWHFTINAGAIYTIGEGLAGSFGFGVCF